MYITGEWGHFNKKDEGGQTCGYFGLTLNECVET